LLLTMMLIVGCALAVPIVPSDFSARFAQSGNEGALGSYACSAGSTSMPLRYGPDPTEEGYTLESCAFTCLALGYRYAGLGGSTNNNCQCEYDLGIATQFGRASSSSSTVGYTLYDTAPLTGWYPLVGYLGMTDLLRAQRFSPEDRSNGFSLHTCNAACIAAGYRYFGLQDWYANDLSQCWCQGSLPAPLDRVQFTVAALEADPQRFSTYYLGGPDQVSLYETCFGCLPTYATANPAPNDPTVTVAPPVPADVLLYNAIGPFKLRTSEGTPPSVSTGFSGASPASCNQFCVDQGLPYFALGDYLPSRQSRCICSRDLSLMTTNGPTSCGVRQPAWQWYGSGDCIYLYETCTNCTSSAANAMIRPADTAQYTFLGAFSDTLDRALRYGPQEYGYTVDSCNAVCTLLGYAFFALQDYSPSMLSWCSCDSDLSHAQQYGVGSCAGISTASSTAAWSFLQRYYGGAGCNALYRVMYPSPKSIGTGSFIPWYNASNSRSFHGRPVPETQRYRSMGQFIDRIPRALSAGPHAYGYNTHSCNAVCLAQGYTYFALQAYHYGDDSKQTGQSWCSCTSDLAAATQYGPATTALINTLKLNFGAWEALGGWGWNSIYETCAKENCSSSTSSRADNTKFPLVLANAGGDFGALGYGGRGWRLGGSQLYPTRSQLPSGDSVELAPQTGNAWTPWLDPFDSRLLLPPVPGGERRGDGWFTNAPMEITIATAPTPASNGKPDPPQSLSCLKVTFYLLDFDSTARRESIEVVSDDGDTATVIYTTNADFYSGQYVSVLQLVGKTVKYRLRRVAGANIVCSGVLLDDFVGPECTNSPSATPTPGAGGTVGLVIGISIGAAAVLLLVGVIIFVLARSRHAPHEEGQTPSEPASNAPLPATFAASAAAPVDIDMTRVAGAPVMGIPVGYPYPAAADNGRARGGNLPGYYAATQAHDPLPSAESIRAAATPDLLIDLLSCHSQVHPVIEKAFLKEEVDGYVFMECDWPTQIRSLPIDLRPPELQIQKWERFRVQISNQAATGAE
jgi:hypothetical protein